GAAAALRVHHGAVDQTTITTGAPPEVMKKVRAALEGMGMEVQVESEYKYRCVRAKRGKGAGGSSQVATLGGGLPGAESAESPMYGDPTQDQGDEVRFYVELTRLDRLNDTFSLDIRRLKGNLRSYKFLYDTLR
ncbi:hypothetical protein HETIRDRAFT_247417, partial [Heterobasidion irregulare TC 32-1]